MRKGYRTTVLRQLREKRALGLNSFVLRNEFLSVQSVTDADEPSAYPSAEMHFAEDASGSAYVVNLNDGQVAFIDHETGHRLNLGTDLRAFVDALGPSEMPWQ